MNAAAQIIRLHETGDETMAITETVNTSEHSPGPNREEAFERLLDYGEGRYIVRCNGIDSDVWDARTGTFESG